MTSLLLLLSLLVQQPGRPEFGTISGQLRDINGAPAVGVRIAAVPAEADATDTQASTTLSNITRTSSAGHYELEDVRPGRYRIVAGPLASPNYYPGVTVLERGKVVTIVAGQVLTYVDFAVDFVPVAGLNQSALCRDGATGIVIVEEGSPEPVTIEQKVQVGVNGQPAAVSSRTPCRMLNTGYFISKLRSGANTVTVAQLPVGYYLKSMTAAGVDLTSAPLIASSNLSAPLIEVVISTRPPAGLSQLFNVSGRVTSDDYPLDPRFQMVFTGVPATGVPDRLGPTDVRVKRIDGSFEIRGVPPGRYVLQYGADQSAIEVASSNIANLELKLVPSAKPTKPEPPVPLNPSSILSIAGTVELSDGNLPKFEITFKPTRAGAANQSVTVSGRDFSVSLPEGEYSVRISGLPEGYAIESVSAGPLDLTESFLVTRSGIADRFTGAPILVPASRSETAIPAGITVRLVPSSSK